MCRGPRFHSRKSHVGSNHSFSMVPSQSARSGGRGSRSAKRCGPDSPPGSLLQHGAPRFSSWTLLVGIPVVRRLCSPAKGNFTGPTPSLSRCRIVLLRYNKKTELLATVPGKRNGFDGDWQGPQGLGTAPKSSVRLQIDALCPPFLLPILSCPNVNRVAIPI